MRWDDVVTFGATYCSFLFSAEPSAWAGGSLRWPPVQLRAHELQGCGVPHERLRLGALSLCARGLNHRAGAASLFSRAPAWVKLMFSSPSSWGCDSSNSSITRLVGRIWKKPRWTWTCSCGGSTKSSSGWSQRSVCARSSARGCSFSRSFSRSLPSECGPLRCLRAELGSGADLISCFTAARSTGTWTPSLPSSWGWATRPCAGWTRPGRWVADLLVPAWLTLIQRKVWSSTLPAEASQQVQKVPRGVWEPDGERAAVFPLFRVIHFISPGCISHHASLLALCCHSTAVNVMEALKWMWADDRAEWLFSTGPVQEPPGLPADHLQAGPAHHPLHAAADEGSELFIVCNHPAPFTVTFNCCLTTFSRTWLSSCTSLPDMTFTHEGNKTFIDNLVNFEKMVRILGCQLVHLQ